MRPVSLILFLALLLGLLATALAGNATGVVNGCRNGEWDPSIETWENENMGGSLEAWWKTTTGNGTKQKNFSQEIGKIGDAVLSLACGINTHDQCVNPSCDDFLRASEDIKWAYFVRVSMVNLSRFLKAAHDGVTTSQADFNSLRDDMAEGFLPWQDMRTNLEKASPWLSAITTSVLAFVPMGPVLVKAPSELAGAIVSGVQTSSAAFIQGCIQELASGDPGFRTILNRIAVLSEIGVDLQRYSERLRTVLEDWSVDIFSGRPDANNSTILDYLKHGRFLVASTLKANDVEKFYKKKVISLFVNEQIRNSSRTFVMCGNFTDPSTSNGPVESRYIKGNRVCYLYSINGRGNAEILRPLKKLAEPQYNITPKVTNPPQLEFAERNYTDDPQDIVESSVGAYDVAGFNYTPEIALKRLSYSATLNESDQAFKKGAAWEGTWNIPVCDVGNRVEWLDNTAPCCCGANCEDTGSFMNNANMGNFGPIKRRCKKAFPGYSAVNYGSYSPVVSVPRYPLLILIGGLVAACAHWC